MNKWSEEIDSKNSNVIYSHVRLTRNWDKYVFPSRVTATQYGEIVGRLREGLRELKDQDGQDLSYSQLDQMQGLEKVALRECRTPSIACVSREEPSGLLLSADEPDSIVLDGGDHIRMQVLSPGLKLDELRHKADVPDDHVNGRFSYAFDEKYGYPTSFPTNMDTGLRTCVVLHLPTLSQVRKFQSVMADMSRFEAVIRDLYEEGDGNYESLHEVSNQQTLGQPEKEIVELTTRVAAQLNNQEIQVRSTTLDTQHLEQEDETYRSYGVLRYAREITEKDARIFTSQLMAGEEDGPMKFNEEYSLYNLIIGIKPADLNPWAKWPLDKDELDTVRVVYIRQNLPEII